MMDNDKDRWRVDRKGVKGWRLVGLKGELSRGLY